MPINNVNNYYKVVLLYVWLHKEPVFLRKRQNCIIFAEYINMFSGNGDER